MSPIEHRTLLVVNHGSATLSAALLARPGGRWRLLAATRLATEVEPGAVARHLVRRVGTADGALAGALDLAPGSAERVPRLLGPAPTAPVLALLAGSARAAGPADLVASGSGWRVVQATPGRRDPRATTGLLLRPEVGAAVLAAGTPPGADERSVLDELVALLAAVRRRRPSLPILVAGGAAALAGRLDLPDVDPSVPVLAIPGSLAPHGGGAERLAAELLALHPAAVAYRALERIGADLASVLRLRVMLVGLHGPSGTIVEAAPGRAGEDAEVRATHGPDGAFVRSTGPAVGADPPDLLVDDEPLDALEVWSGGTGDLRRLADRSLQLRLDPRWGALGEGAAFRALAARDALQRLFRTHLAGGAPVVAADLVVATGEGFAGLAPAGVFEILLDGIRRPGGSQLAWDHAGILGALGAEEDAVARRSLVSDLLDDLLLPLGGVVTVGGVRRGSRRSAPDRVVGEARLVGEGLAETPIVPLPAGVVTRFDVPPGAAGTLHLGFRETVVVGASTRSAEVTLAGGLFGLAVDLRPIPLHRREGAA